MDERQAQIRERAGLEESRLNEDFIEFLRKYGFWLLLIAAGAGGFTSAKRWYTQYNEKKVDAAFQDLEAARAGGNGSPEALANVANEHRGIRAVTLLANLEAGDAYLRAIRKGVKVGAEIDAAGVPKNADDILNDADRDNYLSQAAAMYQAAADAASSNPGMVTLKTGALFGLAAIAECKRDIEKAKGFYEQIQKAVEGTAFAAQGEVAKERIAKLPTLASEPKLLAKADLPDLAPEEKVDTPTTPQLNLEPVQVTPGNGTGAPAATPVPPTGEKPAEKPAEPPKTDPAQPAATPPAQPSTPPTAPPAPAPK
ncbi:MAG: hypothetical protein JSR77_07975 [Planctomycetes bacterium]|nr:hypothetical protein [Planctomycetota bacterium]